MNKERFNEEVFALDGSLTLEDSMKASVSFPPEIATHTLSSARGDKLCLRGQVMELINSRARFKRRMTSVGNKFLIDLSGNPFSDVMPATGLNMYKQSVRAPAQQTMENYRPRPNPNNQEVYLG